MRIDPARADALAHVRGEAQVPLAGLAERSWEEAAAAYLVVARIRDDGDDLAELLDPGLEPEEFDAREPKRTDLLRELAEDAGVEDAVEAFERERDEAAGGEGAARDALRERVRAAGVSPSDAAAPDPRRLRAFAFQEAYLAVAGKRVEEHREVLATFATPTGAEERGLFSGWGTDDDIEEAGAFVEFFCHLRADEEDAGARFGRLRDVLVAEGFELGTGAALVRPCGTGARNVRATLRWKTGEQTCLSRAEALAGLDGDRRAAYEAAVPLYRRLPMLPYADRKPFLIRDHRVHQPSRNLR